MKLRDKGFILHNNKIALLPNNTVCILAAHCWLEYKSHIFKNQCQRWKDSDVTLLLCKATLICAFKNSSDSALSSKVAFLRKVLVTKMSYGILYLSRHCRNYLLFFSSNFQVFLINYNSCKKNGGNTNRSSPFSFRSFSSEKRVWQTRNAVTLRSGGGGFDSRPSQEFFILKKIFFD